MNLYAQLLYKHFQSLPVCDYIRIRDELCAFMNWSLSQYYRRVNGEVRLKYQERMLIEAYFQKKIFKIE